MNNRIIDQPARDKIINDLHTNFLVEAGAGSGKTKSLVDRMVNLIYTGTCEIHELVAITFTRKAADELKVRFQTVLEKTWKEEQKEPEKTRLATALQNIERCFLGTVHSFCAKLLRERPIEAGIDLSFSELEEEADLELLEEAWQNHLHLLQEEKPEELQKIADLGIVVDGLFQCLRDMKEYPDVEWITSMIPKPDLKAPYRSFIDLVQEAAKSIPEDEPDKGYDVLQRAILFACNKEKHMNEHSEKELIKIYEAFNKNLKPTLNRWNTKEDAKFYFEKISSDFEGSIQPLIKEWKEYCHPIIVSFLRGALKIYEEIKVERSLLNFQDLLLAATGLLKKNPLVRQYFQEKYRFLLIDEYQDTDPIQAELMFYLVSENITEQVWTKCRPRPGSLFIVGDPKQAIYRFRRADIDTYNRVKQLMEEHGGEVLQLTMNFRTLDSITTKLNGIFKNNLPETETIYQAAYRPLNSYHKDDGNGFTGIKTLVVPSEYSLKDVVVAKDAENIASAIKRLTEDGYHPKDFMVLTRYTEGISVYAKAIGDVGIPVSISGEIIIGEIKEFRELAVLLRVFTDPTDEVSLIGILRGMFFGISDDELYQWKIAGGRFSIYANAPEMANLELKEKFLLALTRLQTYQKWIRSLPPTAAIEKIIEDIGFYLLLLQHGHHKRAYKGLMQIIEALRKQELQGKTNFKQAANLLNEMVNEKTVVANLEEDADAVRVMNVHKAKGLEAPIVFLAHPIKKVSPDSFLSKHIKREDYSSKGYFSFSIKTGMTKKEIAYPREWEKYRMEELNYLSEEEVRILYVAATRAEKALIISTSAKSNNKNPWVTLLEIDPLDELEIESDFKNEGGESGRLISLDEYQKACMEIEGLDSLKEKSYDIWSPTKDKDFNQVSAVLRDEGGGMEFGSLVHDVLEKVVKGFDVHDYIKLALNDFGISTERYEEVLKLVDRFKTSSVWAELQIATEIYTEVPINMSVLPNHPLYSWIGNSKEKHPFLVKGVIDLIYKNEEGGWVIVDYKTDRVKNKEDISKLETFYSSQICFYKDAWEALTNESVAKEYLYFIAMDHLYLNKL
jgi:ATP-dependent helicase/nuclease subunit A